MLTVLTVSSASVLIVIILVPVRPSQEKAISMPSNPKECLRVSQSSSEYPRIFGQCWAARDVGVTLSAHKRKRLAHSTPKMLTAA
jgi:hypothetical protein